jgi:hypothetical protein
VKTTEVSKSRVNLNRSSKGTRVDRLAYSGIGHSGGKKCDRVKTTEVPKSRSSELIQTIPQKGHVSEYYLVWEFDIQEKQSVIE